MSRFLRALSKIGLVELDEDARRPAPAAAAEELDDAALERYLLEDEPAPAKTGPMPAISPAETAPPAPPPPAGEGSGDVIEGRPFQTIYSDARIPASPYPAEKMLRVLDGLAAMDPATRKAAVLAMDNADDAWTIDDPLLDAERKSRALDGARGELVRTLGAAEARAEAELRAQDEQQAATVAEIRASIAELEQMMAQAIADATAQKEAIKSRLDATRGAVARETARFEGEMARLGLLGRTFGSMGGK
ncbi:MAG: hypothetical protein R3F65_04840 [bacterium]